MNNERDKLMYNLGARDMLAYILAETKDKIKLPEQAEYYKKTFGKAFQTNMDLLLDGYIRLWGTLEPVWWGSINDVCSSATLSLLPNIDI